MIKDCGAVTMWLHRLFLIAGFKVWLYDTPQFVVSLLSVCPRLSSPNDWM